MFTTTTVVEYALGTRDSDTIPLESLYISLPRLLALNSSIVLSTLSMMQHSTKLNDFTNLHSPILHLRAKLGPDWEFYEECLLEVLHATARGADSSAWLDQIQALLRGRVELEMSHQGVLFLLRDQMAVDVHVDGELARGSLSLPRTQTALASTTTSDMSHLLRKPSSPESPTVNMQHYSENGRKPVPRDTSVVSQAPQSPHAPHAPHTPAEYPAQNTLQAAHSPKEFPSQQHLSTARTSVGYPLQEQSLSARSPFAYASQQYPRHVPPSPLSINHPVNQHARAVISPTGYAPRNNLYSPRSPMVYPQQNLRTLHSTVPNPPQRSLHIATAVGKDQIHAKQSPALVHGKDSIFFTDPHVEDDVRDFFGFARKKAGNGLVSKDAKAAEHDTGLLPPYNAIDDDLKVWKERVAYEPDFATSKSLGVDG